MTTKTSTPKIYAASVTYRLRPITCYLCGVLFGMEAGYDDRRIQDHRTFYCPNGHDQHYIGKTAVQIAHEERDAARSLAERESNRRRAAERKAEHERRVAAAHKGWNTRIRNRIANGVCPCCNRSFVNVQRHMQTQHPDFAIPDAG